MTKKLKVNTVFNYLKFSILDYILFSKKFL